MAFPAFWKPTFVSWSLPFFYLADDNSKININCQTRPGAFITPGCFSLLLAWALSNSMLIADCYLRDKMFRILGCAAQTKYAGQGVFWLKRMLLYLYSDLRKSVVRVMLGNRALTCGFRDCLSVICTAVKTGLRESSFCGKTSNFQQGRAVGLVLSLLGFGVLFPRDSSVLPVSHGHCSPFLWSTVLRA